MTCKTVLMAFVALAVCLLAASTAANAELSQNAAVRRHANMIQARPARRSIDLGQGQRLRLKRQTAEQLAQAAALKAWDDEFHRKNAEWQQAALAALAKGQIPPSFDEYWNGKDDDSGSSSDSGSSGSDSGDSSSGSDSSDPSSGSDSSGSSNSSGSSSGSDSSDSSSGSNSDQSDSSSASTTTSASSPSATTSSASDDSDDCDDGSATTSSSAAATTSNAKQYAATPTSTSAAAAPTSGSSQMTGQGTYFATGLGACGQYNTDADRIVAISHSLFDSFGTGNPNNNPVCGHKIKATYQGKSTTVTVVDRCEGCAWGDLDFTETAFQDLAPLSVGRLYGVTWQWLGTAP